MRHAARRLTLLVAALACASPAGAAPTQEFTTITKTATSTTTQTDVALWTPASGKAFALFGCTFSAGAAAVIELEVNNVDVIPPVYLASAGTVEVGGGSWPIYQSEADAVLTYTTTKAPVSIRCSGYEFQP